MMEPSDRDTETPATEAAAAQALKVLDLAVADQRFENGLYWQRSLFFWGFVGAAFIAYAGSAALASPAIGGGIGCFGLVCSVAWSMVNRASAKWQDVFVAQLHDAEIKYFGKKRFLEILKVPGQKKAGFFVGRDLSVTVTTTALSDFCAVVWFALSIRSMILVLAQRYPALIHVMDTDVVTSIVAVVPLIFSLLWIGIMWRAASRNRETQIEGGFITRPPV